LHYSGYGRGKGTSLDQLDTLAGSIWHGDSSPAILSEWRDLAETVECDRGEIIVRQFHPATHFYVLIAGEIEHRLLFAGRLGDVSVGRISQPFLPLGWSGFAAPYRYATTARAISACTLYRWPVEALDRLFYADPAMGQRFFHHILSSVQPLLEEARQKLEAATVSSSMLVSTLAKKIPPSACKPLQRHEILEILGHSLFMEVFPENHLERLADCIEVIHFHQGEQLYRQGTESDQLTLLAKGSVAVSHRPAGSDKDIFLRSYSTRGQIIATMDFCLNGQHQETATAITDVTVLSVNKTDLQGLCEQQLEFALILARRLLWLLSSRLRTLRIQRVAQQYDEEHLVIQNLLSQVSPQLGIVSKLYKLPHLLASRLTHAEALAILQEVQRDGTRLERTLASVCHDLLGEVWRELDFYDGLHDVYQSVTQAPVDEPAEDIRHQCNQGFKRVFDIARYRIAGTEHLPAKAGNIVMLKHLISHPYHALANGFEFALDTHFVSAMILEPRYGDGGVRVVRRGRGEEHGHHRYYDRLGHLYVNTAESDALLETAEQTKARYARFTQTAGDALRAGLNLIICPEGSSHLGKDSPSEFKKGAFHLAAAQDPEPLIVPIAVANFDKRLKNSAFAAVVREPFYLTDKCDPHDPQSLNEFLHEFRKTFRTYVIEAQALADDVTRYGI